MFQGKLISIYVTGKKATPLTAVEQANAVAGLGIEGDRYCAKDIKAPNQPDQEVTLIEIEALEALGAECEIKLDPSQARRNLVTRHVPLNHLVNKEFKIGEVTLRGLRLCEPCSHLEKLTQTGVMKGLCHRGGLRAQIIKGGTLRAGDVIRAEG